MKKINLVLISVFITLLAIIMSCNDNDSTINDEVNSSIFSRGDDDSKTPDECNQDEFEDESGEVGGEIEEQCIERQIPYVPAQKDILYSIRDNILLKYPVGIRYVNEYYFTSRVSKDYSQFSINNFVDVIELMPYIYEAREKFIDPGYSGVIISSTFSNKLINVLEAYKRLSDDQTYKSIIDSFIFDVNTLKNKNSVIEFMEHN